MARECSNLKAEISIRETLKMAFKMSLVSSPGLEEVYMTVAGTRVRDME
jgi:hypothetical protein